MKFFPGLLLRRVFGGIFSSVFHIAVEVAAFSPGFLLRRVFGGIFSSVFHNAVEVAAFIRVAPF